MLNNSRLAALKALTSKVTIYIPATINVNKTIDNTAYVDAAATMLSNMFGGATSEQVSGYWVSDTINSLVKESTTKVYANCNESDLNANLDTILDFAEKLKVELNQDAIAVEINGGMYFI